MTGGVGLRIKKMRRLQSRSISRMCFPAAAAAMYPLVVVVGRARI
jgi:hypothetical protein